MEFASDNNDFAPEVTESAILIFKGPPMLNPPTWVRVNGNDKTPVPVEDLYLLPESSELLPLEGSKPFDNLKFTVVGGVQDVLVGNLPATDVDVSILSSVIYSDK